MSISTKGSNVRRKFKKHMDFFLSEGGSCSYDNDTITDKEVPLTYRHYRKNWEPNPLPEVNISFCIDGRTYRIAPSSLHGLGLFSMDGVNVPYNYEVE